MRKMTRFLAAPLSIGLLMSGTALGLADDNGYATKTDENVTTGATSDETARTNQDERQDAQEIVREAAKVVDQMKSDDQLAQLLERSKGVYVVPDFGQGAFIVGGSGGAGVMLSHRDGSWSDPVFYDFGAISLGAQAGGSAGSVAFILMSDNAVDQFKQENNFALNAGAGLSIINYSADVQASAGKGDIVFWSDTEGAYAGATVSISDINWDEEETVAYYGEQVTPEQILSGQTTAKKGNELKSALRG